MERTLVIIMLSLIIPFDLSAMSLEQACAVRLTDQLSHLEPYIGALYWESGIIKRYFNYLLVKPKTNHQWLIQGDGQTRLLHALFTTILHQDDIDISDNPSFVAKHLQPSTIGKTIECLHNTKSTISASHLEDIIIQEQGFVQSIASTAAEKKKYAGKLPVNQLNRYDTSRLFHDKERDEKINCLEKRKKELTALTGKKRHSAQKELSSIELKLKQLSTGKQGGDYNRVREYATALLDAYQFDQCYAPNTALAILLAFLYRKAKTADDYHAYKKTLTENEKEAIITTACTEEIPCLTTMIPTIKELLVRWQTTGADINQLLGPLYKPFIFAQIITRFYHGALPKKAEYTGLYYAGHNFSDCTERLIYNLCNIILYDKESGTFVLSKAPKALIDKKFIAFYEDKIHKEAINVECKECYENWLPVVENQPWIAYRRKLCKDTKNNTVTVIAPSDSCGFIKGIPETVKQHCLCKDDRIQLGNFWYLLAENPTDELYDMEPSIRNIIITMDRLFAINLVQSTIEKEFLRPDFNAHFFPLLCDQFDQLRSLHGTGKQLAAIDDDEYQDRSREIYFEYFKLFLARSDADITIFAPKTTLLDIGNKLLKNIASLPLHDARRDKLINLLALVPLQATEIPLYLLPQLLFFLPIENPETTIELFGTLLRKKNIEQLPQEQREWFIAVVAQLIAKLPRRFDWRYQTRLMKVMDPQLLNYQPIKNIFDELLQEAERRMTGSAAEKEELINFFEALVFFEQFHPNIQKDLAWFFNKGTQNDIAIATKLYVMLSNSFT